MSFSPGTLEIEDLIFGKSRFLKIFFRKVDNFSSKFMSILTKYGLSVRFHQRNPTAKITQNSGVPTARVARGGHPRILSIKPLSLWCLEIKGSASGPRWTHQRFALKLTSESHQNGSRVATGAFLQGTLRGDPPIIKRRREVWRIGQMDGFERKQWGWGIDRWPGAGGGIRPGGGI